jgi:hypothetical protein
MYDITRPLQHCNLSVYGGLKVHSILVYMSTVILASMEEFKMGRWTNEEVSLNIAHSITPQNVTTWHCNFSIFGGI